MILSRRGPAFALSLMAALVVGCRGEAPTAMPVAPREMPAQTAYMGVIATPAPVAASAVPSVPSVVAADASLVAAAYPEALEQARAASAAVEAVTLVPSPSPARAAAPAVQPIPRVVGARARVIDRGPTTEKRVALTFDAGADRGYAEQILNTLRAANVRASFGMTGQWAEANPDLLRRMVAEGHQLINHTQSHDSFTGFSTGRAPKPAAARARELQLTEEAVQRIGGVSTKPYFRPPYGDLDATVSEDVYAQGYEVVAMWTVDSQGWNGLSRAGIETRCLRAAAPGAVYVFHVGSSSQDGPALAGIIEGLRGQGYQMGTLDWLLRT
ncbi:MAG: polysaccharide deacetylase family protein [Dehalococcoidia bacterium]|nr:MAG: polysaccharide deacetylase family protein [Dehalococcoidia bacterium]